MQPAQVRSHSLPRARLSQGKTRLIPVPDQFVPDKLTGADSPFLVGVLVIAKVAGSGLEAQQDTIEC